MLETFEAFAIGLSLDHWPVRVEWAKRHLVQELSSDMDRSIGNRGIYLVISKLMPQGRRTHSESANSRRDIARTHYPRII